MKSLTKLKIAAIFIGAVSLLHCLGGSLLAQAANDAQNGIDKRLKTAARVNPLTRALELNITLATYPGRAGNDVPITLNYSSKQWEIEYVASYPVDGNSADSVNTYSPKFSPFASAGWTTNLDYLKRPKPSLPFGYDGQGSPIALGSFGALYQVARRYSDLPTGTRHELRRDDNVWTQGSSLAGTYYSVDGSQLKFDTASNTLWLPDGSRYVGGVFADRNGNQEVYSSSSGTVQDSLGRSLGFSLSYGAFGPTVGDVTYQLPGFSGGTDAYVLKWRRLENSRTNPGQPLHYTAPRFSQNYPGFPGPFLFESPAATNDELVGTGIFNPVLLQQLVLPNGSAYTFSYNVFGELDRIVHPSGAVEEFTYGIVPAISSYGSSNGTVDSFFAEANRGVIQHRISPSGNGNDWMVYQYSQFSTDVTNPDGTKNRTIRFTHGVGWSPAFGFEDSRLGLPLDEQTLSSSGEILRRKLTEYQVDGGTVNWGNGRPMHKARNPRPVKTVEVVIENGVALAKTTSFSYDQYLNVIQKSEYGFVNVDLNTARTGPIIAFPSGITPVRTTETDYVTDVNYINRHLISLPAEVRIRDGAGNPISKTQYVYDESDLPLIFYGGTPAGWVNPSTTVRGNVTRVRRWVNTSNTWLQTRTQYDQFGNVIKSWDSWNDNPGNNDLLRMTETEFSGTYQYAFPTLTRTPVPDSTGTRGSSTAFTTTTAYDFQTGLPISTMDANGQTTTMEYNDSLNRVTAITPPSGGARQEFVYGDTPGNQFAKTRIEFESGRWVESTRFYDGLMRVKRVEQTRTGGNVFVDTEYDVMGRIWRESNPYRVGDTVRWMTSGYDALGRLISTTTPDGASVNTSYGLVTSGTLGLTVTTSDEAGKLRRTVLDAFGRVVRVDEPDAANQLGGATTPVQATSYAYNVLDNLTQVNQGGQARSFVYDSLERLVSMTTPEAGTASYMYDAVGNLVQRTDSRGVAVNFNYDRLDRQTLRTYTLSSGVGTTSTAEYFYDGTGLTGVTPSFANGQLTRVSNGSATQEYRNFNAVGRVLSARQIIDGNTFDTSYTYNFAGEPTSFTYPSGRVVNNTYGDDAFLSFTNGRGVGRPVQLYASNFEFAPHGGETKVQYGNGLTLETAFNTRLQRSALTLRQQTNTLWNIAYDYGTTDNNGTVKTQSILHPGITQPLVQTFTHDSLNRLLVARETQNAVEQWKQTFTYDRFGNRSVDVNQTSVGLVGPNPVINPANNRINPQMGELYAYDAAGNLATDQVGKRFVYDGEHRLSAFAASQSNLDNQIFAGEYRYDAEGRRVKKIVGTVTTLFVYDVFGKLIAEYAVNAPTPAPRTQYLTNDALSSPRVITDGQGLVVARRDFAPFGEELPANPVNRPTSIGYQNPTDTTRQRFAGNQRDEESGLDLVRSRMYASNIGRFNMPDPIHRFLEDGDELDRGRSIVLPQGWNRYLNSFNSPTAVDPAGRASLITYGAGVGAINGESALLEKQNLSPESSTPDEQSGLMDPSSYHLAQSRRILEDVIESRGSTVTPPQSVPLQSFPKGPKPEKIKPKKKKETALEKALKKELRKIDRRNVEKKGNVIKGDYVPEGLDEIDETDFDFGPFEEPDFLKPFEFKPAPPAPVVNEELPKPKYATI